MGMLMLHAAPQARRHPNCSKFARELEQLSPDEFQRTLDLALTPTLTPTFVLCRELAEG